MLSRYWWMRQAHTVTSYVADTAHLLGLKLFVRMRKPTRSVTDLRTGIKLRRGPKR